MPKAAASADWMETRRGWPHMPWTARMPVTVRDMHQHVIGLCARNGIAYNWCRRPTEAWTSFEGEEVCIPRIHTPIAYAVSLHEVGHILGLYQQSGVSMVREIWAWQWAKDNALIWTPVMDRHAVTSLGFAAKVAHQILNVGERSA